MAVKDVHPDHALLGASSSDRWSHCPGSVRYEELFGTAEESSVYADEGTLAHSVCEVSARYALGQCSKAVYTKELAALKKEALWDDEMLDCAERYVHCILSTVQSFEEATGQRATVKLEQKLDYGEYAPDGFGTADCAIICGDKVAIIDYKHGKGIPVAAKDNSQLRLYALGVLNFFAAPYVRDVRTVIVQPRVSEEPKTEDISAKALREWGEGLKKIAEEAWLGLGAIEPGSWCKWCKGAGACRARAEKYTALEQESTKPLPGIDHPNALTDAEVAALLPRLEGLTEWAESVRAYARTRIMAGGHIDGYKVVAGKANRAFSNGDAAIEALISAGWDAALLYDRKPKSLAQLEKVVGKEQFAQHCGQYVIRPEGKPTLVVDDNPKQPLNLGASEFEGIHI